MWRVFDIGPDWAYQKRGIDVFPVDILQILIQIDLIYGKRYNIFVIFSVHYFVLEN